MNGEPEPVFVAVTVITHSSKILAVHNPRWGSFTLPMTRQRKHEGWETSAIRAATECLGKLFHMDSKTKDPGSEQPLSPPEVRVITAELNQSDRTEEEKLYNLRIFELALDTRPTPVSGLLTEWLTADQFLDENLRPISSTARFVISKLNEIAEGQGKRFPDSSIVWA